MDATTGVTATMICRKCSRDLPGSAFYKTLRTKCKECHKSQMSAHTQTPGYKDKNAKYQRVRLLDKENYRKHAARTAIWYAKQKGRLEKPPICSECGSYKDIEGHHEDYDKRLEVEWLCRNCHTKLHTVRAGKQRQVKDKANTKPGSTDDIIHNIHYKTRHF